jgi:uncharacterized protein (TIGR00251 family)
VQDVASDHPEGATLSVRVKPRASKSRVLGIRAGALEVAVAAPPVDGAANLELSRTLAEYFGLARGQVRILSGATGKHKRVRLSGTRLEQIEARLNEFPR